MRSRIHTKILSVSILGAVLFMYSTGTADEIYEKNKKANNLYKLGKYDDALKLYDDALLLAPHDNKLKANKGSTLYKKGDFDKAEEQYNNAITDSLLAKNANTHFNMGNILYRQGEKLQISGDPGKAKEKFQAALEHYIKTLDGRPDDIDAKWNLQLAHARIKQAEQQQQQQQNKDNKDNKENKDQQKNDQDQQNKDQQNKDQNKDQNQQDNKDQEKKDDKKQENQDQQNEQEQQQKEQQEQQAQLDESKQDMKKEEAKRLIELYADDADSLNKPQKKANSSKSKIQKDW
ncbi:MAG: tetratricopeptide repeat protein [Fibrobacter sp.]|nr:tetratricopeptide repeat protein [Fibrobacter sp.]